MTSQTLDALTPSAQALLTALEQGARLCRWRGRKKPFFVWDQTRRRVLWCPHHRAVSQLVRAGRLEPAPGSNGRREEWRLSSPAAD